MIQNVLAAVLAAHVQGISIEDMKAALETFIPSASQTPGRLNLFEFKDFTILLDYAHNPAGMRALQKFTDELDATVKVGIIAGIGDRRVEDNNEMGVLLQKCLMKLLFVKINAYAEKQKRNLLKCLMMVLK